ncbi:hypothetical protein D3C76_1302960 [compost metagenome]
MVNHQVLQQFVFSRGELQHLVPEADFLASAVNPERAAADLAEQSGELVAQPGLNPGEQLIEAERFNHIIICADGQAFNPVINLVLGCKHNDSNLGFFRTEITAYLKAVHPGHHHIENRHMRLEISRNGNCACPVRSRFYFKAFVTESQFQKLEYMRLVINEQETYTLDCFHH